MATTALSHFGLPGQRRTFLPKVEAEIVVEAAVTGGYEQHPFMRPVKRKEEKEEKPEVISPVIEVKVDKRRKPKIEKKKQAAERINLTETYKQEFADEYFKETLTEHLRGEARAKAEAELKRKRRNRAVALLLLH